MLTVLVSCAILHISRASVRVLYDVDYEDGLCVFSIKLEPARPGHPDPHVYHIHVYSHAYSPQLLVVIVLLSFLSFFSLSRVYTDVLCYMCARVIL